MVDSALRAALATATLPREPGPLEQLRAGRLARRLPQLYIGLVLYGLTAACMIRSRLGNDPWDVLHQGIAVHLGVAIGTVTIVVSGIVLLAWIPLRQLPASAPWRTRSRSAPSCSNCCPCSRSEPTPAFRRDRLMRRK